MSDKDKKDFEASWRVAHAAHQASASERLGPIGPALRSIHPLGMRVVVKIRSDDNRTDSGLYLPEGAKQNQQDSLLGEVLEVASAIEESNDGDDAEEVNISGIPAGALVLIPRDAGVRVPWDENLRIVESKHILALVEVVDII